jgi:HD-GYP domain
MGTVTVANLKPGDKLGDNVLTPLGNILMHKGKVITERDKDILRAFLVTSVNVENGFSEIKSAEEQGDGAIPASAAEAPLPSIHQEYNKMVEVLRTIFNSHVTGQGLPMMDIRSQLESLLHHIESYKILTFVPNPFIERDYILHNSVLSAMTSYLIAQWVGLAKKDWMQVALAGLLKDIGTIRVDRSILLKPDALNPVEKEEMKKHTVYGYQLLKNAAALNEGVKLSALQHHEKVDGSGYPLGIDSSQIHPYAKIVGIADIFHAMTLDKAYRKKASPYLVLEQIQSDAFGKLDPAYVRIFVDKVTRFHHGTVVRLSDNRIGEIVFSDQTHPTRPWVSVDGQIINLTIDRHLHITEVVRKQA